MAVDGGKGLSTRGVDSKGAWICIPGIYSRSKTLGYPKLISFLRRFGLPIVRNSSAHPFRLSGLNLVGPRRRKYYPPSMMVYY
jgi:hypothetical protein